MIKKILFSLLMIFIFSQSNSQTSVSWSTPMIVADGNQYGSMRPRIAFANGQPVVLWGNNDTRDVFVSRFNGTAFSNPVNVAGQNIDAFVFTWTGAEIAASGNNVYVTYTTEPAEEASVVLAKSTDGGLTFGDTIKVDPWDTDLPRFSTVETDVNGNPLVLYMRFDSAFGNPVNVLSRSMNGGSSFMNPAEASSVINGDPCDCCNGYLVVDENYVLNLFRNNDNNIRDSWCAISTNGGSSFNESVRIDTNNWMIMSCPSSTPVGLIKGDELVGAFMNSADGMMRLYLSKSNLSNQSLSLHRMLKMSSQNQNHPRIAGDNNRTGIVWQESSEVMFTYSMDEDSLGIKTDTLNNGITGFTQNPDVVYADGNFHAVWGNFTTGQVYYSVGSVNLPSGEVELAHESQPYNITKIYDGYLINSEDDASLLLYSLTGQLMEKQNILSGENFLLVMKQMSIGFYLLQIQTDSESFTEKLIGD